MKNAILFIGCLISTFSVIGQQKVFTITTYGAKPDGETHNTQAIQKAIDEANAAGGGRVLIPAGRFVTGVLHMKSNVGLYLAENAVLLGTSRRSEYGPKKASALLVADGQKNISITGKGTIDGQSDKLIEDIYRMLKAGTLEDNEWQTENPWHQIRPAEENRPKLLEWRNCDGVQIKGITFRDGTDWIQKYVNCTNLIIDSIRVESTTFLNNDGIDVVDCRHVKITNSFINAADDGICLKSEDRNRKNICEDIYIANCKVRSSASALKFGTASWSGFKDITVRDLVIYDTYRSAIALEVVDGGFMENIDIRNIKATNTGNAIFIRIGHRNKDTVQSRLRHIYIGNVTVDVPKGKPDKGYREEGPIVREPHNVYPSSIVGLPDYPIEDVVLENIEVKYEGGASKEVAYVSPDALTQIPEKVADYPEFSMFGELPAWGFYVRHAKGVTMKNVKISYKDEDFRTPMIFDDVKALKLVDISIPTVKSAPAILLHKTDNATVKKVVSPLSKTETVKIQK
ncbi:glycoside hydrolase family 28 protein [Xanthocytophaga flava]|uniref:glycoside hydrolase family 28 protein n=1 Tax=Xanthocytophaga flava TaxID=3048013 RepID=UPI0028D251A7|nr:glycosyl hydrolase family 28 protein [Xanthocytophaga flavus]MDJ1467895.1 glycosyl hydrolase family 28 protein [Xanthocytophaga flavus]